jgi:hypothetical protein
MLGCIAVNIDQCRKLDAILGSQVLINVGKCFRRKLIPLLQDTPQVIHGNDSSISQAHHLTYVCSPGLLECHDLQTAA